MARRPDTRFAPGADGSYHVPYLTDSAAERILASGVRLVALDSTTVEPQTGHDPIRFGSDVHYRLLGNEPPVFIVEGLNGDGLSDRLGFAPDEGLLHVVPRRVNAEGADASHSRVFLYVYRNDADGSALRALAETTRAEEFHG
jgi:kynurenine formamidase